MSNFLVQFCPRFFVSYKFFVCHALWGVFLFRQSYISSLVLLLDCCVVCLRLSWWSCSWSHSFLVPLLPLWFLIFCFWWGVYLETFAYCFSSNSIINFILLLDGIPFKIWQLLVIIKIYVYFALEREIWFFKQCSAKIMAGWKFVIPSNVV